MAVTAKSTRTTLTLEADVVALLEREVRERGVAFKVAVNDAIRRGLTTCEQHDDYAFPVFEMGAPRIDLTKANQIAAELENEEIIRKMREGR